MLLVFYWGIIKGSECDSFIHSFIKKAMHLLAKKISASSDVILMADRKSVW
jgi:hypothetical protein